MSWMRFCFHSTPVKLTDPEKSTSYTAPAVTTDGGNEVGLTAPVRHAGAQINGIGAGLTCGQIAQSK